MKTWRHENLKLNAMKLRNSEQHFAVFSVLQGRLHFLHVIFSWEAECQLAFILKWKPPCSISFAEEKIKWRCSEISLCTYPYVVGSPCYCMSFLTFTKCLFFISMLSNSSPCQGKEKWRLFCTCKQNGKRCWIWEYCTEKDGDPRGNPGFLNCY